MCVICRLMELMSMGCWILCGSLYVASWTSFVRSSSQRTFTHKLRWSHLCGNRYFALPLLGCCLFILSWLSSATMEGCTFWLQEKINSNSCWLRIYPCVCQWKNVTVGEYFMSAILSMTKSLCLHFWNMCLICGYNVSSVSVVNFL